jgi:hypothetical protein
VQGERGKALSNEGLFMRGAFTPANSAYADALRRLLTDNSGMGDLTRRDRADLIGAQ